MDGASKTKLEKHNYKKCCLCGKNDFHLAKVDGDVCNHIRTNFDVHVMIAF